MPSFLPRPAAPRQPQNNLPVTRYYMDHLLEKLEAHLAPRRPGARGEPGLRRYVLLSNTFRAAQTDLVRPAPPAADEPAFDLYDMLDEGEEAQDHERDEMWLQSCLDELVRADEEMELQQARQREVVLYRDQQVPDAVFNDDDEDEDEEANLSMESGGVELDAPWMDDAKAWPVVDPLAVDDGGGGPAWLGDDRFAFC